MFFYIAGMQEEQGKFEEHGYWNLSFIASMTQKVIFYCVQACLLKVYNMVFRCVHVIFLNRNSELLV